MGATLEWPLIYLLSPRADYLPRVKIHARIYFFRVANVAELVDAPDLGSGAERCESSSLSVRTIKRKPLIQKNHF
ncbi:protein of unknown function [Alcaligenes faecalis subsp. faecalis]|nr:protein of unknown function [Alcaligenes faecalis subsp. faecalis]